MNTTWIPDDRSTKDNDNGNGSGKQAMETGSKSKKERYLGENLIENIKGGTWRIRTEHLPHPGPGGGLEWTRYFTEKGKHPYDDIEWTEFEAKITNDKGKVIFEQPGIEAPKSWSQLAVNVVVSKYFRGKLGEPTRERSIRDLVGRVADTISNWGRVQGYFKTGEDARAFNEELTFLLVNQYGSFNSPVWFNVGVEEHPQGSACFINQVDDTMESIMDLAKTEGMLFKYGSGTGTNLSSLRSSKEHLSAGGIASGPVSFMKGFDAFAGVIKSGGKTRRAAKMVMLDVDHPDIETFIKCKVKEEEKAYALMEMGFKGGIDGEAYSSVFFQNSNNSVRVSDDFMQILEDNGDWYTRAVTDKRPMDKYKAGDLMNMIADSAWKCGDPGLQYDSTINRWHTCKGAGRINASNPCSEYMFLDNSACNLASLNLLKFLGENDRFDTEAFEHAVDTFIMAQEIIVSNASYPRDRIAANSHVYRPLGLGYANLGAMLMSCGLPYDSDEGRVKAGAVTALMTGRAYKASAGIAEKMGPFLDYPRNRDSFLGVIGLHKQAVEALAQDRDEDPLIQAAKRAWDDALDLGSRVGYRNAQVSVLAPTGTIAFMMDCDTTGIEPDLALVKYKKLAGGGMLKIVNNSVPRALKRLNYDEQTSKEIVDFIHENDTIEGCTKLRPEHLSVFDCAFRPANGERSIHYNGHLRMMGAVQPFISGAISKTVNMPNEATQEDIIDVYKRGWKLGLKAVAVYRDGSKAAQPLYLKKKKEKAKAEAVVETTPKPIRRKPPEEREAITHKFSIAGHEGYITVGKYKDGSPCEIFLTIAKEGSTVSGLMDGFATMTSLALQYGTPLETLVEKFSHMRFEPQGFTTNGEIPIAKSVYDYIFRWLASKFLDPSQNQELGNHLPKTMTDGDSPLLRAEEEKAKTEAAGTPDMFQEVSTFINDKDAPSCPGCGTIMTRNGACYKCGNCGATSGCS